MTIILDGTTGITNDGGYTGDGISFADTTPANTLVTTTGGNVGIGTASPSTKLNIYGSSPSIYLEQNTGVAGNTQIRLNAAGGANTASIRIQDKYIWNSTANGSQLNIGNDLTTPQAVIDSSGNVGIGTTPSSWSSGRTAVQLYGSSTAVYFAGQGNTLLTNNYYYNAADKYIANGGSGQYLMDSSSNHIWYTAPVNAGGAGASATYTERMRIDNSGNLLVGTTSVITSGYRVNIGSSITIRPWLNWIYVPAFKDVEPAIPIVSPSLMSCHPADTDLVVPPVLLINNKVAIALHPLGTV